MSSSEVREEAAVDGATAAERRGSNEAGEKIRRSLARRQASKGWMTLVNRCQCRQSKAKVSVVVHPPFSPSSLS